MASDAHTFGPSHESENAPEEAQAATAAPADAGPVTDPQTGGATTPAAPNPNPIEKGKVRLKTDWMTNRFDPGPDHEGLPVITNHGTDVDPGQVDELKELAAKAGLELEEVTS